MSIFSKVTMQSLKKNKMRTAVTIIGIMLSTALVCAVMTSFTSAVDFVRRQTIYYNGNWHACTETETIDDVNKISSDKKVEETSYKNPIGYALRGGIGVSKHSLYYYVSECSENWFEMLSFRTKYGRFPQNSDEVVLPIWYDDSTREEIKLGDKITLEIGERKSPYGEILDQSNPCHGYDEDGHIMANEENLDVFATKTYTVVGFYEGGSSYANPGIDIYTIADGDNLADSEYRNLKAYFRMKEPKKVFSFMKDNNLIGETNNDLLITYGASGHESITNFVSSAMMIVIGLIMFGSIALIYNAFTISVSERKKQFGLLSSIGATKKQLRRTVYFEALVVGVIGIPLGILLGLAGIGVTFGIIGEKFSIFTEGSTAMKLCITPSAIIASSAIALVTIFISAMRPAISAAKITAVEAIRQTNDIKAKKNKIRTPKIVYKLFGLHGMLAHKYFKRSKKRYRATILSLFMSIVLFISASAFTENLIASVNVGYSTMSYDIEVSVPIKRIKDIGAENVLSVFKNDKDTKDAACIQNFYATDVKVDQKHLTSEGGELYSPEYDGSGMHILFVDDDAFIKTLEDNKLSIKEYMNSEVPVGLLCDKHEFFNNETQKYETGYYFSTEGRIEFELSYLDRTMSNGEIIFTDEVNSFTAYSGKTLREFPFYVAYGDYSAVMIYPMSARSKLYTTGYLEALDTVNFCEFFVTS